MSFFVNPTLYKGRPEDMSDRTQKEIAVYDLLDKLGIFFERVDHDRADTVDDCVEVEKIIGVDICKNLFLCNRQQTDFYLLMMPGRKPFRTSVLSKEIGTSRLSFGSAEKMEEYLDITPGSVSIMGLMNDKENRVRLLIDRDIYDSEFIRCHPCINTSTLKISFSDILNVYLPFVKHGPTIVTL